MRLTFTLTLDYDDPGADTPTHDGLAGLLAHHLPADRVTVDGPDPFAVLVDGTPHCPNCGATELRHVEEVSVVRQLVERREEDGALVFDGSGRVCWESSSGERFMCEDCDAEFSIPEGVLVDFS